MTELESDPTAGSTEPTGTGFLNPPAVTDEVQALYDEDVADEGYVMNLTHLWAHDPEALAALSGLIARTVEEGGLSFRQRGVLVSATAAALGDSYCAFAWGRRLAKAAGAEVAAAVLEGRDEGLAADEQALAAWARAVVGDPNRTTVEDVDELRDVGFDDGQIFAITTFIALRLAFATINDALGAQPDGVLATAVPPEVHAAVTFGRPAAD
jgi:uncharacterized peroxidase-related enzyme